jgi:hypothetical protein
VADSVGNLNLCPTTQTVTQKCFARWRCISHSLCRALFWLGMQALVHPVVLPLESKPLATNSTVSSGGASTKNTNRANNANSTERPEPQAAGSWPTDVSANGQSRSAEVSCQILEQVSNEDLQLLAKVIIAVVLLQGKP